MIERRHNARARVIYSGVIAYDERRATMNCVVRNFSEDGVKVEFENAALLPDEIDLLIAKKSRAFKRRSSGAATGRPDWRFVRMRQTTRSRSIGLGGFVLPNRNG